MYISVEVDESFVIHGATKYRIPNVDEEIKLGYGEEFSSIENVEAAYMKYAQAAGLDVSRSNKKKNSNGDVILRYLLCSQKGFPTKRILILNNIIPDLLGLINAKTLELNRR